MRVIAIDLTRIHDEEITIRWLKSSKETNYILESNREDGPCHLLHYLDYTERYNTVFDTTGVETQHERRLLLLNMLIERQMSETLDATDVVIKLSSLVKRIDLILFTLCLIILYMCYNKG